MNIQNIQLGVMKDISNMNISDIRYKILEEYNELENELRLPSDLQIKENILAEAYDLMQVAYTLIRKITEKDEHQELEIIEANIQHIEKLQKRGYIE